MSGTEPKPLTFQLLRLLSDGEFHSGERLANQLGVARATVHNALQAAAGMGLELYSVRGRGYCLSQQLHWLDVYKIRSHLGSQANALRIDILDQATSSNALMLQLAAQGAPTGTVLAVEWQSAGRGRMGRAWHAGLGNALTFSLLWRFQRGVAGLSGLSLAIGVGLIRALHELGVTQAELKWPNDILLQGGKLAGLLLEAQGDMLGPSAVVIGVGLNLRLPQAMRDHIEQQASDLAALEMELPERNQLFAVVLKNLTTVLEEFTEYGFPAMREEWERHHAFQQRRVRLLLPDGTQAEGVARGVTDTGALRLDLPAGERIFNAGEISLRGM